MNYHIKETTDGLEIIVEKIDGHQQEILLAAFQSCQQGQCSCPTNEYTKLETLEISAEARRIHLRLQAQAGQQFSWAEIEKCLAYTMEQTSKADVV